MKSSTGPGPQLLKGYFKTDNITIIHQVRSRLYQLEMQISDYNYYGVNAILKLHMNYQRFGEIFSKFLILIIKIVTYMEQWEDKKAICHKFPGFEI